MRGIFILFLSCIIFTSCIMTGKKVVIHDTKKDIKYVATENGVMIEGDINLGDGKSIKIENVEKE